jgi:hypothetical protein
MRSELLLTMSSLFVRLVADGWCWFVLREKYCWLVASGWFVLREKYCWLVADKPNEQGGGSIMCTSLKQRNSYRIWASGTGFPLGIAKIGSIPLKEPNYSYLPSIDFYLDIYHGKIARYRFITFCCSVAWISSFFRWLHGEASPFSHTWRALPD